MVITLGYYHRIVAIILRTGTQRLFLRRELSQVTSCPALGPASALDSCR